MIVKRIYVLFALMNIQNIKLNLDLKYQLKIMKLMILKIKLNMVKIILG